MLMLNDYTYQSGVQAEEKKLSHGKSILAIHTRLTVFNCSSRTSRLFPIHGIVAKNINAFDGTISDECIPFSELKLRRVVILNTSKSSAKVIQ